MIKNILTIAIISITITACSQKQAEVSLPKFISFEDEVRRIAENAPCELIHGKADAQSVVQYDFGCHGGKWGSVSLYLDEKENTQNSIQRMRLLWKEKNPKYSIGANEKEIAEEFLMFISRAYNPDYEFLKTVFFGNQPRNFSTTHLNFDYTFTKSKIYSLHRLEITHSNSATSN